MKKLAFIVLFLIGAVLVLFCPFIQSQKKDFIYKISPYKQNENLNLIQKNQKNKLLKSAIDLTKYLPKDFVKDASKDYTAFIQKGLDENKIIRMPNFPLLVNEKGLDVKSGSRILFQKLSSLSMIPNSLNHYAVLKLFNIIDVEIYSPVIIGERNEHIGNKGEWGFGIYIQGANHIQIINPKISDCWGDGIVIGKGNNGSRNIKIINGVIDNCRRNGISICDGSNIEISNPIISNTQGTMPMCGIDIEPDDNFANIDNITILNPITFNNLNAGILIYLDNFIGNVKKNVRIKILNHLDDSSYTGFILGSYKKHNNNFKPFSGVIEITSPKLKNNRISISTGENKMGPKVYFKNIKIENSNENIQKVKKDLSKKENIFVK
jgi:hypothetical protein